MKTVALLGGILGCWLFLLATGGASVLPAVSWAGEAAPEDLTQRRAGAAASTVTPDEPREAKGPSLPIVEYSLKARLNARRHVVSGTLDLLWRNPSVLPAERLPFHLYLNAFSHNGTRLLDSAWRHGFDEALRSGGWGAITVRDVRVDGEAPREVALEDDGTVMRVVPAKAVPGHGAARVTMSFEARLPRMRLRTGYVGDFHLVGQWFPKIGRREPGGAWHCEPFHLTSEFYADFGTYDVSLEVPRGFEVAATGSLGEVTRVRGGARRLRYRAARVHDFAWVAAPGLERLRGRLGGVTLEIVHRGVDAPAVARHLAHVREALSRLQRWLAPYPYPLLTTVLVPPEARAAGGMEYPTFITSAADHPPFLERMSALNTTVHELTHQYFYGLLASNEVEEPWLDEGFTTYVAGLVMDDLHGSDRSALDLGPFRLGTFQLSRIWYRTLPGQDPASRRGSDFSSPRSYFANVYGKASLALRTLEGRIGRGRMLALLGDYVRRFRFRHPRGEDFFRLLDAHVPAPALRRFFREAVGTDGVLDYAVDAVQTRPLGRLEGQFDNREARARRDSRAALLRKGARHLNRVLLVRHGALRLPVPVRLRFADGSQVERTWDGEGRWHWIEVPHRHALVSAEIDPGRSMALERTILDNGRRVAPDARPARRVAGRLLVGLQLLLGSVGF